MRGGERDREERAETRGDRGEKEDKWVETYAEEEEEREQPSHPLAKFIWRYLGSFPVPDIIHPQITPPFHILTNPQHPSVYPYNPNTTVRNPEVLGKCESNLLCCCSCYYRVWCCCIWCLLCCRRCYFLFANIFFFSLDPLIANGVRILYAVSENVPGNFIGDYTNGSGLLGYVEPPYG